MGQVYCVARFSRGLECSVSVESVDPTRINLERDPLSRRFRGIAYHGNVEFDVPYMSHIIDNLWVGGCEQGLILPTNIEHVISLYPWEAYSIGHEVKSYTAIRLYDSLDQAMDQLDDIANWAVSRLRDGETLIHCQAGLNRSNLVAARTLMLWQGVSAKTAISLLREKRSPAVLCNTAFEEYLNGLEN